jgi:aminoglycoside 3-N-acetyltransferase
MMRGRDSADLAADLRALGVRSGQHLLVHCSLQNIGHLGNGPQTVLDALRDAAGPATIVVPAYTARNSISSASFIDATEGLSRRDLDRFVAGMPGFDSNTTESQDVGALAEFIRTRPGAARSGHPQTSFAALGPRSDECTREHALNGRFGESSPLGWLHAHDGAVLLLGVGYEAFSAFHLAEYLLSEHPRRRPYYCFVMEHGERRARELWDVDLDDSDFAAVGRRMDAEPFVARARVGEADSRLVPVRPAVKFALTDPAFQRRRVSAPPTAAPGPSSARPRAATGYRPAVPDPALPPGRYFFLSYARLPPLPPVPDTVLTDPPGDAVIAFFDDLSEEVVRRSATGSVLAPGFLAITDPVGRHWQSALAEALGSAEAFVPLLSLDYYRRSWPRRERAGFLQRLRDAGVADPQPRLAPVLWEPLPTRMQPPELPAALSLASDTSLGPYRRYGLLALQRQPAYRSCYEQVVAELATRIVAIAEKRPLGPSPVRLDDAEPGGDDTGGLEFAVLLAGGQTALGDPASAAQYARLLAERQGCAVTIAGFTGSPGEVSRGPGVILVEARESSAAGLSAALSALPPWVLPVVLADWTAQAAGPADRISVAMPHKPYWWRPDFIDGALRGVGSLKEFVSLMPALIARAKREYLRHGLIQPSRPNPAPRPKLGDLSQPAVPPVKENPHG